MPSNKPPMSTSYKAIFAFSIMMIFVVIIGGAISGSKSVGFGIWYWGYMAWKMYKRDNNSLVSLQKAMLWFQSIAFSVGFIVLLFSESKIRNYVNISLIELCILATVSIGLSYLLYKFFRKQLNGGSVSGSQNDGTSSSNLDLWERVSDELKSGVRSDALWTRAFAEVDGDNNKANARYIRLRVEQLAGSVSRESSIAKPIVSPSISKRSDKKRFTLILAISALLIVGFIGFDKVKSYLLSNRPPVQTYLGITLNSSMDEVKYILGAPSDVLYEDKTPFKLADGSTLHWSLVVATKDEISARKGVNNFFYWHFDLPEYRIDLRFDPVHKRAISIGCYVSNSSSFMPKDCEVLGVKIKDEESAIVEKLGKPSKEELNGVTKTLFYDDLNLKLIFEKKRLYYTLVESAARPLSAESKSPPYDAEGWTQESTGSKEVGPWLSYSPKGTRYCRYSDGVIHRLYPPGIKPNAEKANPFCLGDSSEVPR